MTEEVTRQFLARLWELQAGQGMTNAELARRLGCHRSYVVHLKAGRVGKKRIGLNIALKAAALFPELGRFFLPSDLPVSNNRAPSVLPGNDAEEPQP